MMREFGEAIGDSVIESVGRAFARTQEQRPLAADVLESEDAYLVVFDAPGVEREDVQVQFDEREVAVRIDRFREFREEYEMRFPGRGLSLEGSARLPDGPAVDPKQATATLTEAGTVQVEIPKRDEEVEEEQDGADEETDGPDDEHSAGSTADEVEDSDDSMDDSDSEA